MLPVALLAGEYLLLTFLVDLSGRRFASRGVDLLRLAVPIAIGTAAAGWLVARPRKAHRDPVQGDAAPDWRPWTGIAGNLAAFALAAALAWRTFVPGAPDPTPASLVGLVLLAAVAALFAAMTAGPIGWLASRARPLLGALPAALGVGLVAWWVSVNADATWNVLSSMTLRIVAAFLGVSGGKVTLIPAELAVGLDGFEVEVARQCSGMDGIGLFVLVLTIWLVLDRERLRLPLALVLLAVGTVTAFVANAARIALLVWVGASGHPDLAVGGLHSKLGWIFLVGLALGGIALVERSPWLRRRGPAQESPRDDGGVPPETGAYVGPFVAAMATALVTGIWAEGSFDPWYGARILAPLAVLIAVRHSLPSLRPSGSWVPVLVGAGVAVVWVAVSGREDGGLGTAVAGRDAAERWAWVGFRVVGSVVVIPIAEELAFRGFLLPWLVSPDLESVPPRGWTWPSVLLSSLAFGAIHESIALGTMAGLAFAFARLWRGRLGDAVLAHAVANAGVALAVLAGGRWDLWR